MMKSSVSIVCFIIVLAACGTEDALPTAQLEGSWDITWLVDGYEAFGNMELHPDGSGLIVTENDLNSPILPGKDRIPITWLRQDSSLIIIRQDNAFALSYQVAAENNAFLNLTYAEDIEIFMQRQ